MKPFILIVLTAILAAGCCKERCNQEPLLYVNFNNLSPDDTDSVYVISYMTGSLTRTDSSFRHFPASNWSSTSFFKFPLPPGSDYTIRLSSINREFHITDIVVDNQECSCGNTVYGVVTGFKINGVAREGPILNIP